MRIVKLEFINKECKPQMLTVHCDTESAHLITMWYGSFYAGDEYNIKVDGKKVKKDHNGEIKGLSSTDFPLAVRVIKW